MSHSDDLRTTENAYGESRRTARPLFALIPIAIALAVCLAMLAEGLHVMTTPAGANSGEAHIAQAAAPSSSTGGTS
jgi:hypothetical protein